MVSVVRRRGSAHPSTDRAFKAAVRSMGDRKGRGAPVRDAFFRTSDERGHRYPLAALMSSRSGSGGGRGGKTRVLLYLSLLWVAAGGDHSSHRPANFWAGLLGLEDPDGAGARTVRSTWQELAVREFVAIKRGDYPGDVPTIRPLREDGSGAIYTIPAGSGGDTYRRVPQSAWQVLFPSPDLTGAGLAMYLVALRTSDQVQRTESLIFPRSAFSAQYGLGESTRKAGLRDLTELGVLDAETASIDRYGNMTERRRQRKVYDLHPLYAAPPGSERSTTPLKGRGPS